MYGGGSAEGVGEQKGRPSLSKSAFNATDLPLHTETVEKRGNNSCAFVCLEQTA